ncbi:MAG: helix-turn-helix domain-containing protein [Gammaproteobacteria bacterium]|nr:helix-turn-helix domain-containing protein [Gammaproteobacteria bacterium]MBI5616959.1 helix-turn-helix domain-containing protein [Gammaproteobacteria bacterium]
MRSAAKPPTATAGPGTLRLAFVLTDQMLAASSMLPNEMWRAAAGTAGGRGRHAPGLAIEALAADDRPVGTLAGVGLEPTARLADAGPCDVVYLPALWRNPRPVLARSRALLPWLRMQFEHGAMIAGVGTGCCLLAEAGLLDGKAATTHWHYFERFARDYPRVQLKRQYFITQAGSIFCAASVNALADVTVHLIERFYGRAVASHVERNFSHEIRRPYEKYRYLEGDDLQHADETVIEIQLRMQRELNEPLRMDALAREFGLSLRTLTRRFRDATGTSPLEYLQRQRIRAAKELLESTNLTIAEVAYRVGYLDQGHFARLFERAMTVGPREYRRTVRAKVFSIEA